MRDLTMKRVMAALMAMLTMTAVWAGGVLSTENPHEVAWQRLFAKFYSPKTGLLYEHLPDDAYVARFRNFAAKADFAHHMSPALVYPVLADAMLRQVGKR